MLARRDSMNLKLLILLLLVASCSPKSRSPVLATVNGDSITLQEFQKALGMEEWKFGSEIGLTGERLKQLKTKVVESLLKDRILLEEARTKGVKVTEFEVKESLDHFKKAYPKEEDFNKLLEAKGLTLKDFEEHRKRELTIKKLMDIVGKEQDSISDEEIKSYYDTHSQEFQHPQQVHARQIVTDSKEKADSIHNMLVGGASFEEVARKYSLSPDRKQCGDLGWFGKGIMPQEFEQICFHLKINELSPVVKTPYGFHIFQVLEMREAGQSAFDEVREEIRERMVGTKGRGLFQSWYEGLRAKAKIEVRTELLEEKL